MDLASAKRVLGQLEGKPDATPGDITIRTTLAWAVQQAESVREARQEITRLRADFTRLSHDAEDDARELADLRELRKTIEDASRLTAAAAALQGLLANDTENCLSAVGAAREAVELGDALLRQLAGETTIAEKSGIGEDDDPDGR